MIKFEEFESPVAPVKPAAATAEEIRERFPNATALVEELKAACPELFKGATVLRMAETVSGHEMKTIKYREIEKMRKVSVPWWCSVTEACKRNQADVVFTSRKRK